MPISESTESTPSAAPRASSSQGLLLAGAGALIALNFLVLLVGVIGLNNAYGLLKQYERSTPYAHLEELDKKLINLNREIRGNYEQHKKYMRTFKWRRFGERYPVLSRSAIDSEAQWRRLVELYREGVSQAAGDITGSKEWHRFYDAGLKSQSERSLRREQRMRLLAR